MVFQVLKYNIFCNCSIGGGRVAPAQACCMDRPVAVILSFSLVRATLDALQIQ
jgi:hypothetical protein